MVEPWCQTTSLSNFDRTVHGAGTRKISAAKKKHPCIPVKCLVVYPLQGFPPGFRHGFEPEALIPSCDGRPGMVNPMPWILCFGMGWFLRHPKRSDTIYLYLYLYFLYIICNSIYLMVYLCEWVREIFLAWGLAHDVRFMQSFGMADAASSEKQTRQRRKWGSEASAGKRGILKWPAQSIHKFASLYLVAFGCVGL